MGVGFDSRDFDPMAGSFDRFLRAAVGLEPDPPQHHHSRLMEGREMDLYARQGDLLIWRIARQEQVALEGLRPVPEGVILRGERTGHSHRLVGTDLMTTGDDIVSGLFAKVAEGAEVIVVHEEHDPIPLPPGGYSFTRQRVLDLLSDTLPTVNPLD